MIAISMYKDTFDQVGVTVYLDKVLEGIKEGRWSLLVDNLRDIRAKSAEQYKEEKKMMPAVTFGGTFTHRKAAGLHQYSGIVILDIDDLPNETIFDLRAKLAEDEYIFSFFESPSGEGLKVLVSVETDPEHHKAAFLSLEKYFSDKYQVKLDPSGKDVSRLCYVSSDKDIHIRYDAKNFPVDIEEPDKRALEAHTPMMADVSTAQNDLHKFRVCILWTERNFKFEEGQRNAYLHNLACNCNRVGLKQEYVVAAIDQYFPTPDKKWVQSVRSAYLLNKHEHGKHTVYKFKNQAEPKEEFTMVVNDSATDTLKNDLYAYTQKLLVTGNVEMTREIMKGYLIACIVKGDYTIETEEGMNIIESAIKDYEKR